jgi:hypothetical protein
VSGSSAVSRATVADVRPRGPYRTQP